MIIELPFGDHVQKFDTDKFGPALKIGGRFRCDFPSPPGRNEITAALIGGLKNIVHLFKQRKVLTIVNDGYRRTPTAELLPIIWDYLKDGEFIVATGSHRVSTDAELAEIFGQSYAAVRPRLSIHDCFYDGKLANIGTTSRGTPVSINKKVLEAEVIFTINSVEPHFFAGFTGGRKSLIPGLASFETIMTNHRLAKDINSCTLNLETNPLHLDLEEGVQLLGDKPVLSIQCITDRDGRIIELFAGDMRMAFYQACEAALKYYTVPIPKKYDVVIANCDPPLDANLYQLQKAQEHGGRMVRDGGVLIVMGACKEGVGSKYFMELASKYPTPEAALNEGIADDSFGIHKLVKTARQLRKFKVFYVTTLDDSEVEKVYFKSFKDISEALDAAVKEVDGEVEVGILEDAGYSVPAIKP
jgi:nickel-dependent lactate racemase